MQASYDHLIIDNNVRIEVDQPRNALTIYAGDSKNRLSNLIADFPSNCYINKEITGCGGTTLVLRNNVDYVVLVPYVNLLKSKYADNKDINYITLMCRGGKWIDNEQEILDKLSDTSKPRKVICTYDSLPALLKLKGFDPKQFKLLIDEAHTLVNLGSFKARVCEYILHNFDQFDSYVFLTATPTKPEYFPDAISHLPLCNIKWDNVNAVKFTLQRLDKGTSINQALFSLCLSYLLGLEQGNAHIFYNSVTDITKVMEWLSGIMDKRNQPYFSRDDIRLVCSRSRRNEDRLDRRLGAWGVVDDVVDRPVGKINFYTSTMFEGADIYDEVGRTYIAINGQRDYTKVDFHVLFPQICGRVRNSLYSDTVNIILSNVPEASSCTKEEWQGAVSQRIAEAYDLQAAIKNPFNKSKPSVLRALTESAETNPYMFFNEESGEYYVSDVALKSELQSYEALEATYVVRTDREVERAASGHSATFRDLLLDESKQLKFTSNVSGLAKLLSGYKSFSDIMEEYCIARENGDARICELIASRNRNYAKYYDALGPEKIKALRYRRKEIEQMYDDLFSTKDNKYRIMAHLGLAPGDFISNNDAKQNINVIYERLGINKAAKAIDLHQWYEAYPTKQNGINGLRIKAVKTSSGKANTK